MLLLTFQWPTQQVGEGNSGYIEALVVVWACGSPYKKGWGITEDSKTIYHRKKLQILRN